MKMQCRNFAHRQMLCFYHHRGAREADERLRPYEIRVDDLQQHSSCKAIAGDSDTLDFSESRQRQLRELRLLHHYSTKIAETLLGTEVDGASGL